MSTCGQREMTNSVSSNTEVNIQFVENSKESWRKHLFLAVTDVLIGELNRRFISDESISISKAVSAAFALDFDGLQSFLNRYGTVLKIDRQLLKSEISIFKSTAMFTDILNTEHTQIMSAELQQYPNLLLIMQLAMTLPVSSATCERSFSAMRRVKNYMRSTMLQDRFSALASLHIESDMARKIDIKQLINEFARSSARRIQLV